MNQVPQAIAFVIIVMAATAASAEPLISTFVLSEQNVETFDATTFTAGPNIDIYELVLDNSPNINDVISLELDLCLSPGTLLNLSGSEITFRDQVRYPIFGVSRIAESFFVIPSGTSLLATNVIDTDFRLRASWTVAGGTPLIPAGGEAVVAVLSVPTGTPIELLRNPWGRAVISGRFESIGPIGPVFNHCVPEPGSLLLIAIGIVSVSAQLRI
ncbi:MAG: PEP-CTERM sorting domain-containing protein [Planctomycetota bacterium]